MSVRVNDPGHMVVDYGGYAVQYIWHPNHDGRDLWAIHTVVGGRTTSVAIEYRGSPNNRSAKENVNRWPPYY